MKTLDTEQLKNLMESAEEFVLINVLSEEAFENNHIPGSINIPVEGPGFTDDVVTEVVDQDQRIVVYCADEDCPASAEAAEKLESAGYTNVYDYEGGMAAWQDDGNLVESA